MRTRADASGDASSAIANLSTHQPVQARACRRRGSLLGVVGPKAGVKILWSRASGSESRRRFGLATALEDLKGPERVTVKPTLNSTQEPATALFTFCMIPPKPPSAFYFLKVQLCKHNRKELPRDRASGSVRVLLTVVPQRDSHHYVRITRLSSVPVNPKINTIASTDPDTAQPQQGCACSR